jgi:hypothetical protein
MTIMPAALDVVDVVVDERAVVVVAAVAVVAAEEVVVAETFKAVTLLAHLPSAANRIQRFSMVRPCIGAALIRVGRIIPPSSIEP